MLNDGCMPDNVSPVGSYRLLKMNIPQVVRDVGGYNLGFPSMYYFLTGNH